MNKEEIIRNRDVLIYDFDKVKPEHRILYDKLNTDLALLELDEKYQKLLEFVMKTSDLSLCPHQRSKEYCDCAGCEAMQLLEEIGEL